MESKEEMMVNNDNKVDEEVTFYGLTKTQALKEDKIEGTIDK